ncbi:MAG: hypothetical protein RL711_17 [Bacteroidota bacterium]|jgi:hypothetical protein
MKAKNHISPSMSKIAMAVLLLCSLMATVLLPTPGHVLKVENQSKKAPISHHIHASNELAAVIPSLNVPFFAIQIDFLKPFESIALPLLFEIQPTAFYNNYFIHLLCHFISPRAP